MNENLVNRKVASFGSEEDGSSIFLGKIRAEDLQNEDLINQLEQKRDDLIKQNFLENQSSEINSETALDWLLDLLDIIGNELDEKYGKELNIGKIFWQKTLRLLSFFNEAFSLDLELADESSIIKAKQKKKNILFSFLDALKKKFFKKELTLEEMLALQIKTLEEQLQNEVDPRAISEIKKQLEFLMQLKAKLFELSLEQGLIKTMKWLFTISAMQTISDVARGEYTAEVVTTNQQWQRVNHLLKSGELVKQVRDVAHNDRTLEVRNKPFTFKDQNNNLDLIYQQQNASKDNGSFLKLLYTLLLLATAQGIKHLEINVHKEVEISTQKTASEQNLNKAVHAPSVGQSEVRLESNSGREQYNSSTNRDPGSTLEKPNTQPVVRSQFYEKY